MPVMKLEDTFGRLGLAVRLDPDIASSSSTPRNSPGSIGTFDTCNGGRFATRSPDNVVNPVWSGARPPVAS